MSNLDYKVRLELRHELRALQQRIGITAVYVTHDREEALTLADRIAVHRRRPRRAVRRARGDLPPAGVARSSPASWAPTTRSTDRARADGALVAGAASAPAASARARAFSQRRGARSARRATGARPTALVAATATSRRRVYVGQGYRYRVRTGGADVWVHAPERIAEGHAGDASSFRARRCCCFRSVRQRRAMRT